MQKLLKVPIALSLSALAMAATAPDVQAQTFNFSTEGFFTNCGTDAAMQGHTVTCADPGSTLELTFTGEHTSPGNYTDGSVVKLGAFQFTGNGDLTVLETYNVMFTLVINQSIPTVGSGEAEGQITGRIQRTDVFGSSIVWMPNEIVFINPVTYDLVFDQDTNGRVIAANNSTSIEAVGTVASTVPEPGTVVLLGTGLVGLLGMAHRRRQKLEVV